jgi:dTDP-glucose 4,6-dehydratase
MDATRIRETLGWRAAESFESGLRKTVRWYLDNREWCGWGAARGYGGERLGLGTPAGKA